MAAYRGNRRGMAGMGFVAFIALSVALSTKSGDPIDLRAWTIGIGSAVLALSCVVLAWMATIRLTLAGDGLSYRSMFGQRDMFWAEVEKVFFEATTYSIHGLPVGTHREVRIVTQDGRKFSIGNSVGKTEQMMGEVSRLSGPHLYKRMMADLNVGKTLELGAVRLSRMKGLEMKGLFGFSAIGFDEIAGYEVNAGEFRVKKRGALFTSKVRSAAVANLYPMMAILDTLLKTSADAARVGQPA